MLKRFRSRTATAAVASLIAALGVGGIAVAQNSGSGQSTPPQAQSAPEVPGQESNAPENSATDQDNVQAGDQSGNDANEKADSQANEGSEKGTESESGSEVANDDGPGGHADEPGNPNADHQFEGQE